VKTRPNKLHKTWLLAELKQPLAETPLYACVVPIKGMPTKCPFLRHDLGVIGVVQGGIT